jgi:hypothetical protein
MWEKIKNHFEAYTEPLSKDIFQFQPNLIYANNSISYTILGFPITAFCYEYVAKKKSALKYSLTIAKTVSGIERELFDQKDFFKYLKTLQKQKYLFYIVSVDTISIEDFRNNTVRDNIRLKLKYFLLEDTALKIGGTKLDSSKKTMPKCVFGVSRKGKLKLLYKANKKICEANEYWKPKGD